MGNGAWAGSISYRALATALAARYAAPSTDTGHSGNSESLVLGHPEQAAHFAFRAVHEMNGRCQGARRLVLFQRSPILRLEWVPPAAGRLSSKRRGHHRRRG